MKTILVALGVLTGCAGARGGASAEEPTEPPHPGVSITVELRTSLRAAARPGLEDYERGRPAVDAKHGRVFVGSSDGGLYAVAAISGEPIWRFETLGAVQSEPVYVPALDSVLFGSNDGALYHVGAEDGRLKWRFYTASIVARRPVVVDQTILFSSASDTLLALERDTGKLRWQHHQTPAFGMEIASYAGPAVHGGVVYSAYSDGTVGAYAIDDGRELWPAVDLAQEAEQLRGQRPKYLDVDTTPVVLQDGEVSTVCVAHFSAGVFGLDAATGAKVWVNAEPSGIVDLAVVEDAREMSPILVATGTSGLWGLDPHTGETLWHQRLPEGGVTQAVPVAGAILVGTTRYGLFLFSPQTGAFLDGLESAGSIAMTPEAFGTRAFVMNNGGELLSLHISPPG